LKKKEDWMPDRVWHDKCGGGRNKFFLKNLWLIWWTRSAALRVTLRAEGLFRVTREMGVRIVMATDGVCI